MRIGDFLIALSFLMLPTYMLNAQSIKKAENSYAKFNKLRASNGSDAEIYNELYHSYEGYAAVLRSAVVNSSDYTVSKQALMEIYKFLPAGAVWSQNNGHKTNCILFAQAYMDIPMMEAFKGETFAKDPNHAVMANIAAVGAYNEKQYDKVVLYIRAYLDTGDQRKRRECYGSLAQAYKYLDNYPMAIATLKEAIQYYPNDIDLLKMAVVYAMDIEDLDNLQVFLDKALALQPDNLDFLDNQGKLYERRNDFQKAISVYNKLVKQRPQNFDYNKHLGLDYYNMGVDFFNRALLEQGNAVAKKYSRQANDYFSAACPILKIVVDNAPNDAGCLMALGFAYKCLGQVNQFEKVNGELAALQVNTIGMDDTPSYITGGNSVPNPRPVPPDPVPDTKPVDYYAFAKKYVEDHIRAWQMQGEFETDVKYQARVTDESIDQKIEDLNKEAEQKYIASYANNVSHKDLDLKRYDPNNKTYLIESKYGNMVVQVPLENKEAEVFKSSWSGMQFSDPVFYIDNNYQLMLSSLTFVTPTGKSYRFDRSNQDIVYVNRVVRSDLDSIRYVPSPSNEDRNVGPKIIDEQYANKKSDVDIDIPETRIKNDKTYAFIIANEKYNVVSKVEYANNDGKMFAEYCRKTLGLPKENVKLNENTTYGKMLQIMRQIKKTAEYNADANLIVYYAGHGIPNEETKDAYLLPVDADGKETEGCYSLNRLYQELGELKNSQIVVFLDACFSGAKRDGGMLASTRGVAIKPKSREAKGNMVVFSAADGDQTALPWKEKGHGLFTYFLLKKLQDSKGNVTLKELGDYLKENVSRKAINVNEKEQTPTVQASIGLGDSWEKWFLK